MKLLKTLLMGIALFTGVICFGQTQQVKYGSVKLGPEEKDNQYSLVSVLDTDETGFWVLRAKRKRMRIGFGIGSRNIKRRVDFLNKNMELKKSAEIPSKIGDKKMFLESTFEWNNEIYFLLGYNNRKKQLKELYLHKLNKTSLKLSSKGKKVSETVRKSSNWVGEFAYSFSPDSSKILFIEEERQKNREKKKLGFKVYDKDLSKVWTRSIVLPYKEKLFDVENYSVDNKGNAYVLGVKYNEVLKRKRKGKPNYQYTINQYSGESNIPEEYLVDFPDIFVTDMTMHVEDGGNIVCAGFYSAKNSTRILGAVFFKLDPNSKEIVSSSQGPFKDAISQNVTLDEKEQKRKKKKKKKENEIYQLKLKDFIFRDDGGAILVAEQYYVRQVTSTQNRGAAGGMTTTTDYYYHYYDVFVVNINPEGKIEWNNRIRKNQVTRNDGGFYSSYALGVVRDNIYIVFNDHVDNIRSADRNRLKRMTLSKGKSAVAVAKINGSGDVGIEELFTRKMAGTRTLPKLCEQINGNEMLIYGVKGSKYRFARFMINE